MPPFFDGAGDMKSVVVKSLLFVSVILFASACSEQPAPAEPATGEAALLAQGQQKARMCVGCHGPKGISRVASYPSIAGKPADYLSEQLHALRSGERMDPMMTSIAKNLSDEDIQALAVYFASLPGEETSQ